MASTKTRIKPIRIANETADYFEGKPLNRMVEGLCELLESGKITFDGENLKAESVYTQNSEEKSSLLLKKWNIDEKDLEDLATMATFMGGSVGEMIHLFDEAVNEGAITYEGGKYIGVPEYDLSKLEEACHERGIGMQEAIDKTVKSLRSGK